MRRGMIVLIGVGTILNAVLIYAAGLYLWRLVAMATGH